MKQERTIKELLQLMLDHQDLFNWGICSWVWYMYDSEIINSDERISLSIFIHNNRPISKSVYSWPPSNIKPRIEWINEQIQKLEQ